MMEDSVLSSDSVHVFFMVASGVLMHFCLCFACVHGCCLLPQKRIEMRNEGAMAWHGQDSHQDRKKVNFEQTFKNVDDCKHFIIKGQECSFSRHTTSTGAPVKITIVQVFNVAGNQCYLDN